MMNLCVEAVHMHGAQIRGCDFVFGLHRPAFQDILKAYDLPLAGQEQRH